MQKSKDFSQVILSSLNTHLAIIAQNGTVLFTNNAWKNFAASNKFTVLERVAEGDNCIEIYRKTAASGNNIAAQAANGIDLMLKKKAKDFKLQYLSDSSGSSRWFLMEVILIENEKLTVLIKHEDITDLILPKIKLEESESNLRRLSKHLQNTQDEEMVRIERIIHDELGQQLTVMMMDLAWLDKKVAAENNLIVQKVEQLKEMMAATIKTARRISAELRPRGLDDLGLIAAMELYIKEFEKRSGIFTLFKIPEKEPNLTGAVKNSLFKILQEALTNVAKHSGAKTVNIQLKNDNKEIALVIENDGLGFDEKQGDLKNTLGVLGMKERAIGMGGALSFVKFKGGTTIKVRIPVAL
jgi:signal transduction histidine kinase